MRRNTIQRDFAGGIQGIAGAITTYLGNVPPSLNGTSNVAQRYPVIGHRTARRLSVYVQTNGFAATTTLTVMKDGVATALTVAVPPGSTGNFYTTMDVPFSDSGLDVRVTCPNSGLLARFDCTATVTLD